MKRQTQSGERHGSACTTSCAATHRRSTLPGPPKSSTETAGERALYGFGGLLSVVLGVALLARPDLGAVSLAQVFGFFSLALGIWTLVLAASARATGSRIEGLFGSRAA